MEPSPLRIIAAISLGMAALSLSSHGRATSAPPPAIVAPPEAPAPPTAADSLRDGQRVNIDRATEEELVLLPGIGPSLAARILESRHVDGPFGTVNALDRVSGIGPRTLERLRPLVTASEEVEDPRDPRLGRDHEGVHGADVPEG